MAKKPDKPKPPSKRKPPPKKDRKPKPPPPPPPPGNPSAVQLHRIANTLDVAFFAPRSPLSLAGSQPRTETPQDYMSSRWHRRSGAVYGTVALRGSPNAERNLHADDPSRTVPPPIKRRGRH